MKPTRNLSDFEIKQIEEKAQKLVSSLPKGISDPIFHAFKRRRAFTGNHNIKSITKRELCFKESQLKKELAKEAKRRFEQHSHTQTAHTKIQNSIQVGFVPTFKELLDSKRLAQINSFQEYIEANELPAWLVYNAIDLQQAIGSKYLYLKPHEILLHIRAKYKFNVSAALLVGSPKAGKTLYDTVPKAFTPLYFEMVRIVGMITPDSKLKTFEEHLLHLYNKEIKEVTYSLLHCRSGQELDSIINRMHGQISSSLWVPKQIRYKDKQMEMYFRNRDFIKPELFGILAHSYLNSESNHGVNEQQIASLNTNDIIHGMKSKLESCLQSAKKRPRCGWTVFESAPQKDGFIYNEMLRVLRALGGKVTHEVDGRTKIASCKHLLLNKKYTIGSSLSIYKEATS